MEKVPVYWKTTLQDVEETLKLVKTGTVTLAAKSAGGRPIWMVEYGKSNLPKGTANLSSAMGAADYSCYADKSGGDYVPTIFFVGCVHGGEFEGTSALLNLIKLLETGTDYAGNSNEELVRLSRMAHLLIIPIGNPDGRSRVPFDSMVGKTLYDLRYYGQGTWKDGALCGWPGCKKVHPIKDYVDHLGAYFNDDGINMMHEDFFGGASSETRLVLDICKREAPDFSILLHGGDNCVNHMISPYYASLNTKREVQEVALATEKACRQAQVRYAVRPIGTRENDAVPPSFNLPSAMHHCCGTPAVTYESNQGLVDYKEDIYSYEEIYKAHCIQFAEIVRYYLKKFGKI